MCRVSVETCAKRVLCEWYRCMNCLRLKGFGLYLHTRSMVAARALVWIDFGSGHVRLCPSAGLRLWSYMGNAGVSLAKHLLVCGYSKSEPEAVTLVGDGRLCV